MTERHKATENGKIYMPIPCRVICIYTYIYMKQHTRNVYNILGCDFHKTKHTKCGAFDDWYALCKRINNNTYVSINICLSITRIYINFDGEQRESWCSGGGSNGRKWKIGNNSEYANISIRRTFRLLWIFALLPINGRY